MIETLTKNWCLVALCGALNAIMSAIYLVMQGTGGPVLLHTWSGTVVLVGQLAMAAGVCAIAAGLWRSKNGKSWALALNGFALVALGFIQYRLTHLRISIMVFALLIIVMAVSIGIVELAVSQSFRRKHHRADDWLFGLVGIVSIGFVLPSLALALRWIPIEPGSHVDLLWLGSYFGFVAICLMTLAARLHWQDTFLSGSVRS